jgi:hypothetical protein
MESRIDRFIFEGLTCLINQNEIFPGHYIINQNIGLTYILYDTLLVKGCPVFKSDFYDWGI